MAMINTGRVIGAGLLGGLVINIVESIMNAVVLAEPMQAVYAKMGVPEPGGAAVAGFIGMGFVLGIAIAWTYAAIRPRFGAGPTTAVYAAVVLWVAGCLFPIVSWVLMGAYPMGLAMIALAYSLVEFILAGLVAGKLYKEEAAVAM